MRNILLIIYLSLTPIFVATAATDIDSMECVLAKMPSGDRLVKLDELASDIGYRAIMSGGKHWLMS